MRLPIAYEGLATNDGRIVLPTAFEWPTDAIPLTVGQPFGTNILGTVTALRRHKRGVITGYISHPLVGHAPQIELDRMDLTDEEYSAGMVIKRARIRAVFLGMNPAWPDLMITHTTKEYV